MFNNESYGLRAGCNGTVNSHILEELCVLEAAAYRSALVLSKAGAAAEGALTPSTLVRLLSGVDSLVSVKA